MSAPAAVLRDVLREVAMPELKPRPVSIRRGPIEWVDYPLEDFRDSGWSMSIAFRWTRETRHDAPEVEVVGAEIWTPAGTLRVSADAFRDGDLCAIEDHIRDHIEKRAEAQGDWLRDDRRGP